MIENIELRDIPGFEGSYAATKDGRIWSHKRNRFLKSCGEPGNYHIVMLSMDGKGTSYYVHRLVAMAWLPNPDNLPQVNHKDEHKDNNCVENLEWCTVKYNLDYSEVRTKLIKKSKPVYCIELDKTFRSIFAASQELNVAQPNLSSHLSKNTPKSVGGYHFTYAQEIVCNNEQESVQPDDFCIRED